MTERIYGDQNFRFSQVTEAVFVTPVGADGENEVSNSNPMPVGIGDGANLDAFSRLRTSHPTGLFSAQCQYDHDPLLYEVGTTGSGTTPAHNANTRMVALACTGTGTSFIQSYEYIPYQYGTGGTLTAGTLAIASGYVAATTQNKTAVSREISARYPITLDRAGAVRALGTLSLLVSGIGATSATRASLNFTEIR